MSGRIDSPVELSSFAVTSGALSGDLKLQLHARRLSLPHPAGGRLEIEAPPSPELLEGFHRFGFDAHEAADGPIARRIR